MNKISVIKRIGIFLRRILLCAFTVFLSMVITLMLIMNVICNGGSESAKKMFVTTILETGALKFLASVYLSDEEITEIVNNNKMEELDTEVNTELIAFTAKNTGNAGNTGNTENTGNAGNTGNMGNAGNAGNTGNIGNTEISAGQSIQKKETLVYEFKADDVNYEEEETDEDNDGIIVYDVAGRTFSGKMMVVLDPARVTLESYYETYKTGAPLDKIVDTINGVAGINGGLYAQSEVGGRPYGVTVSHGIIQTNKPTEKAGLVFIGLTEDNILIVENLSDMTEEDVVTLVAEKKIRDGCSFQEEAKDKNNHFVSLVINGVGRELGEGAGSGLNPRTAIGQRADGALLLLVTDGRGKSGHLGASAQDLIEIMLEYKAVNAANLDGGSSSTMVLNGEYLMESVTFRKANTSWNLPVAFVVK